MAIRHRLHSAAFSGETKRRPCCSASPISASSSGLAALVYLALSGWCEAGPRAARHPRTRAATALGKSAADTSAGLRLGRRRHGSRRRRTRRISSASSPDNYLSSQPSGLDDAPIMAAPAIAARSSAACWSGRSGRLRNGHRLGLRAHRSGARRRPPDRRSASCCAPPCCCAARPSGRVATGRHLDGDTSSKPQIGFGALAYPFFGQGVSATRVNDLAGGPALELSTVSVPWRCGCARSRAHMREKNDFGGTQEPAGTLSSCSGRRAGSRDHACRGAPRSAPSRRRRAAGNVDERPSCRGLEDLGVDQVLGARTPGVITINMSTASAAGLEGRGWARRAAGGCDTDGERKPRRASR